MSPDALRTALEELRKAREATLARYHSRSLPFADGLFDRWERAHRLGFGAGASIYDSSCVFGDVQVGENTWIGPWTILDGSGGGLSIGSFCSISSGVQIYTHDTVGWALSGGILPRREGRVRIGDRVYIGSQSIVSLGVTIGATSVVGANSFVKADVPERTIVAGSPAAPIGRVEGDGEAIRLVYDR
ncbi:MAG: acyltransferase [Salinarimonadaceae bacterium]|nr:MAG: acyltransferase [Salinarimonadaceae bacterium]